MKIGFTFFNNRMTRYFFKTDIFHKILKNDMPNKIYVFHDMENIDWLVDEYKDFNFIFIKIKLKRNRVLNNLFEILINNYKYSFGYYWKNNNFIKKLILPFLYPFLKIRKIRNLLLYNLLKLFYIEPNIKDIKLDKLYVTIPSNLNDLLVTINLIYKELIFLQDGWDTYQYYDVHFLKPHKYIVWGEVDRSLIRNYTSFNESRIEMVGIYFYRNLRKAYLSISDKEKIKIKKSLKIPIDKKIILVVSNGFGNIGNNEILLMENLINLIKNKELDAEILIRPYLGFYYDINKVYYNTWRKYNFIHFWPINISNIENKKRISNISYIFDDFAKMFSISDLHLNLLSMSILESRICEVPSLSYYFFDSTKDLSEHFLKGKNYQVLVDYGLEKLWITSKDKEKLLFKVKRMLNNKNYFLKKQRYLNAFGIFDKV